jgi:hypothetical protein
LRSKGNAHVGLAVANRYLDKITDICRLMSQVEAQWRVADTLEEIFDDNEELLAKIDEPYLDIYLRMLRHSHDVEDLVQDLHLLSSLCEHNDEPIPTTQNLIKKKLLAGGGQPPEQQLLPCMQVRGTSIFIWARQPDKRLPFERWRGSWVPLTSYLEDPLNLQFYEAVLFLYVLAPSVEKSSRVGRGAWERSKR